MSIILRNITRVGGHALAPVLATLTAHRLTSWMGFEAPNPDAYKAPSPSHESKKKTKDIAAPQIQDIIKFPKFLLPKTKLRQTATLTATTLVNGGVQEVSKSNKTASPTTPTDAKRMPGQVRSSSTAEYRNSYMPITRPNMPDHPVSFGCTEDTIKRHLRRDYLTAEAYIVEQVRMQSGADVESTTTDSDRVALKFARLYNMKMKAKHYPKASFVKVQPKIAATKGLSNVAAIKAKSAARFHTTDVRNNKNEVSD